MRTKHNLKIYLLLLLLTILVASGAQAQQQTPAAAPSPAADEYATQTGFRNKVFEIRHHDPHALLPVLGALGSGFRGARMDASRQFKTLTVRDFPENIATIEETLKRLDVAEAPPAEIELRIHALVASNAAETAGDVAPELREVINELKSTLNFKTYRTVNSMIQRTREGASANGSGVAEFTSPSGNNNNTSGSYNYSLRNISINTAAARAPIVQIEGFTFNADFYVPDQGRYLRASINTSISVRDGERVVVGTATLKDKALILVMTARVIK